MEKIILGEKVPKALGPQNNTHTICNVCNMEN
jgi:hypothetical protein